MPQKKVSICCAWFNRADMLIETLDSIFDQSYCNIEVVIVNDGSTDPRVKVILDAYKNDKLKVVHQENQGFVIAIKRAISISTGEYIAIHGAGDYSYPDRISNQAKVLDENPSVGIVGCYYEKHNLSSNQNEIHKPKGSEPIAVADIPNIQLSQGELMYRRSAYIESGGYRDFYNVGQGTDLWLRILEKYSLYIVPNILYRQYIFSDGVSKDFAKLIHRRLLLGIMYDIRVQKYQTGIDVIEKYNNHFLMYLNVKKHYSKQLLVSYLYSIFANKKDFEDSIYKSLISQAEFKYKLIACIY
ncbi:glycosyltransferase family A protein, partial [Methylophaga sp.]|uniref:glycosyltransferase family A protein n=1 Tax=Methylophaga sp. TaxID=2024840 RepID=UPI003A95A384